jgi:Domain of unknown function (DUF4625)
MVFTFICTKFDRNKVGRFFASSFSITMNKICSTGIIVPLFCIGLSAGLLSCSKAENDLSPVIVNVESQAMVGMMHGEGLHAMSGSISTITVVASDDRALKQLSCVITTPIEEHSHALHGGDIVPAFRTPNIGFWNAEKITEVNGLESEEKFKFSIPETLSGAWNVKIAALDVDGNITYHEEPLFIQNDSIPAILAAATIPSSDDEGVIHLNTGETFSIQGNILDADFLESVSVAVYKDDVLSWMQVLSPENIWMFDLAQITIPAFNGVGEYRIIIEAYDKHGWRNYAIGNVNVK